MNTWPVALLLSLPPIAPPSIALEDAPFRCPPCGCGADQTDFAEPGACSACGMVLVQGGEQARVAGAPPEAGSAALDPRRLVDVGPTVTVASRFADLPVVEPHVAAYPGREGHLLISAMVVTETSRPYASCRLSSFASRDSGATWTETAHDWWGYDPWSAILPDGTTRLAWIGNPGGFRDRYPIRFLASPDGGVTWDDSVQTLEQNHDGTKLAALGSELYFTTVRFRGHGADVLLFRLEDGRFREVARIDGGGRRLNFCEPAVLPDGRVVVPASEYLRSVWVQRFDPSNGELSPPFPVSNAPGGARGYMRLAADTWADSPFRGRLYFVRAMEGDGGARGVWLNTSTDAGETWSADTRLDLFEDAARSHALVASVAVNAAGVLGVSWVDRQDDPTGLRNDVYFAASLDGGASFLRPRRVSTVGADPRTEANGEVAERFPGGGHYMGLTACADGAFQLVWSDARSGHFELQTSRVVVRPE